jgi:hypothetical protein
LVLAVAKEPQKPRKPRRPRGFGEAQAPFGKADTGLYALFVAYDFRCAFTSADLTAEIKADPLQAMLRLNGASNKVGDVIPACLDAIYAFECGHLALGPDYGFIVAMNRISPEFLEALLPSGGLKLPAQAKFRPRKSLIGKHRRAMVEGKLG